jgi:hypothetical protein
MHSVRQDAGAPPDEFRQTQIVFAVRDDCFGSGTNAQPVPVTVAGLDGMYIEPFAWQKPDTPTPQPSVWDSGVLFAPRGGETTGAYSLAVGVRTMCVYLSWDAATTADELDAARQVVESIRGQPYGASGIRIIFTLPEGWDTG